MASYCLDFNKCIPYTCIRSSTMIVLIYLILLFDHSVDAYKFFLRRKLKVILFTMRHLSFSIHMIILDLIKSLAHGDLSRLLLRSHHLWVARKGVEFALKFLNLAWFKMADLQRNQWSRVGWVSLGGESLLNCLFVEVFIGISYLWGCWWLNLWTWP